MTINKDIPRAGVMGWPIEHSKSPRLHGYWLAKYNLPGSYTHIPSPPDSFEADMRALATKGWRGANVTIPHKENALALADTASPAAKAIGAANTLIVGENGQIHADNTDGFGFIENLKDRAKDKWNPTAPAFILGAGGAARGVIHALLTAGAPEIRIANRTRERAETLADVFGPKVKVIDWNDRSAALAGTGLIVNTTSLGMSGQPPLDLAFDDADPSAVATDIVYTPLITPFLTAAAAKNLTTVDGLGMLLHQARPGFEAWFGKASEVDEVLRQKVLAP
ncbi:MAG: shikimate dehydrogenase [Pikeienuella sp.]